MAGRDVRWGQARRFEFIEWRAYWVGTVNRRDLEERFGISTPQASVDLRSYQEVAPGNIEYDATGKAYVPAPKFRPKFLKVSAERYLRQLNSILTGSVAPADTWFGSPPPAAVLPIMVRSVEPGTLRMMLRSIRDRKEIDLVYQSFTGTRERTMAPHALANDGYRWHVRAWSVDREEFRDFVLSRILSVADSRASNADPNYDMAWYTMVNLKIAPHPELAPEQRATIEHDFGMVNGELVMQTRVALSYYLIRRLNLDFPTSEIPPERQQLVLTNLDEVEQARTDAHKKTRERLRLRKDD